MNEASGWPCFIQLLKTHGRQLGLFLVFLALKKGSRQVDISIFIEIFQRPKSWATSSKN
jgi:hypothetical protein